MMKKILVGTIIFIAKTTYMLVLVVDTLMSFTRIYFVTFANNFGEFLLINSCSVHIWCYYCDLVVLLIECLDDISLYCDSYPLLHLLMPIVL